MANKLYLEEKIMKLQKSCWPALGLMIGTFLLSSLPGFAAEGGLLGIQIGATPRDLMVSYGVPSGVIFSTGGGLSLNTMRGGIMQASANTPPEWAKTVWPSRLEADQQMWIYQLKNDLIAGFIVKGAGDAATVTDIIAASFTPNAKVKTEGGITLGDSLSKVLLNYGYPPLIQPFQVGAATRAAAPGAAVGRPGLGGNKVPNFNRPDLRSSGTGPVAPMGNTVTPVGGAGTKVVVVDQRPISFSKDCMILYNGISLTLYNFKVVRIHITQ
jgi:hypothetical protein